jgi:ADP-ribose pyrophosphatase YjhB (NUDIX family)
MKYCFECSEKLVHKIPEGDDRPRYVCESCHTIHYQNPKIVVGCLPVYEHKILLCRRAIEPRKGFWTLPAGFMENGETTQEGAIRETWEEACAKVVVDGLYRLYDLPHINQVYMFYRASLLSPDFAAGTESLEVGLFEEDQIPWDELAFPVIKDALKDYFNERQCGIYSIKICAPLKNKT